MRNIEESLSQQALVEQVEELFWLRWPKLIVNGHSPLNAYPIGGKRPMNTAKTLKKEGARAGMLDLNLPIPRGRYCGLYIEMKKPKGGRVSPEQKGWIKFLKQFYRVEVCRSTQSAFSLIVEYMESGDHCA